MLSKAELRSGSQLPTTEEPALTAPQRADAAPDNSTAYAALTGKAPAKQDTLRPRSVRPLPDHVLEGLTSSVSRLTRPDLRMTSNVAADRLEVARGIQEAAHSDMIPPGHAHQKAAELVNGTQIFLSMVGASAAFGPETYPPSATLTQRKLAALDLLLKSALIQNVLREHGGLEERSPTLKYKNGEEGVYGQHSTETGSSEITFMAQSRSVPWDTSAFHEGVHRLQENRSKDGTPFTFKEMPARFQSRSNARQSLQQIARSVPSNFAPVDYHSRAREIQAYAEESALWEASFDTRYAPSPHITAAGMHKLVDVLVSAAQSLDGRSVLGALSSPNVLSKLNSPDPEAQRQTKRILIAGVRINTAMKSVKWEDADSARLNTIVSNLAASASPKWDRPNGAELLRATAEALHGFLRDIGWTESQSSELPQDFRLLTSLDSLPSRDQFQRAEKFPLSAVEKMPDVDMQDVGRALTDAKQASGFNDSAAKLREMAAAGHPVRPSHVQIPLSQLLSKLLGVAENELPSAVLPKIVAAQDGDPNLPYVPGLNLGTGQTQLAHFDPFSWSVVVHPSLIKDPQFARELAGVAVEVAHGVVTLPKNKYRPALKSAATANVHETVMAGAREVLDRVQKTPPDSMSAATYLRTFEARQKMWSGHSLWEHGYKPEVAKARENQVPGADEAFRANAFEHLKQPMNAFKAQMMLND